MKRNQLRKSNGPETFKALGLHPLGHAELARNGQHCDTCDFAQFMEGMVRCTAVMGAHEVKTTWPACSKWLARRKTDRAHQLFTP